jgi:hypothetical protein
VSPQFGSDSTVFAGAGSGVYKSVDRGVHWTLVSLLRNTQLAVSPNYASDHTVFAAGTSLQMTRDAGQTWTKLQGGPFAGATFIEAVAVSPAFPSDGTVFVSIRAKGLFKSTDGGATFAETGTSSLYDKNVLIADYEWPTSAPIQFSPAYATDHTVFAFAQSHVVKSTDSGVTWSLLDLPPATRILDPPVVAGFSRTASVTEGASGDVQPLAIGVVLSHPYAKQVTVQWNTNDFTGTGIASSGADFAPAAGTLVFPVGATQATASVIVLGDDVDEPNEAVAISLHDPMNAVVGGYQGLAVGTIVDDDP